MEIHLDTEFIEYKKKPYFGLGKGIDTIELISIGMVDENGRDFYAVCKEFNFRAAWKNKWLRENVLRNIHSELLLRLHELGLEMSSTQPFTYFNTKKLINIFGCTKDEIRQGIVTFVQNWTQDDLWEEGMRYDSKFGNGVNNTYKYLCKDNTWSDEIVGTGKSEAPEFYAYFADYDWVVFCWLFGRMIDLPKGFPQYCNDIKQLLNEKYKHNEHLIEYWKNEFDKGLPPMVEHNALADAHYNKKLYEYLKTTV